MNPQGNSETSKDRENALIDAARQEVLGNDGAHRIGETTDDRIELASEEFRVRTATETRISTRGLGRELVRIGDYHIKRSIDSGGMGRVYEATQEHPRRTVAIKVMKHGIMSPDALRRFEQESQTLARLRHPCIAHLYEAGWYDLDGDHMPYFAMEYIPNARAITKYAEEEQLTVRERLGLFINVCHAVFHAHQLGVIHRDLKPANILVDGEGQVKLIDFGLARSTDPAFNITALQTRIDQRLGTLWYMAPEQLQDKPGALNTRSDIYSLGVVLFELLTGEFPYDRRTPDSSAKRVICEESPTRLSSIDRALRGDLETIVSVALEKELERRYQSLEVLVKDIKQYLSNMPLVYARPPSATYRFRKLVRRRWVPISVCCFLLIMSVVIGCTQFQANMRERDLQKEREHVDALVTLMEASSPLLDFENTPYRVDDVLNACDRAIELKPDDAKAYALRGRIRLLRGYNAEAGQDCAKALRLDPESTLALRTCAHLALLAGNFATARDQYDRALTSYTYTRDLPRDFHNRARVRRIDADYKAAVEDHDRAVAMAPEYGLTWKGRGVTRYMMGDIDDAISDLTHAAKLPVEKGQRPRAHLCYLWIWEMRLRRNDPGDREAAADAMKLAEQAVDRDSWAAGFARVWRGELSEEEYLSSFDASPRTYARASYYVGVKALLDNRPQVAMDHFRRAASRELRGSDEYDLAKWHQRRIAG